MAKISRTLPHASVVLFVLFAPLGWNPVPPAAAAPKVPEAGADAFGLFREEAEVVSAARRPIPIQNAPATVHVLTGERIRALGAQNLWEALRAVPGVDVMTTRTGHGEVSIRGLNRTLNNRTLVLLDGKTVLNGYFDFVTWESIPVTLEEIDRIEVVEGPVSALYGANAVNGVINIITKTPRQLKGATAAYGYGERQTHHGSLLHGGERGSFRHKLALGWDSTRRFERADLNASEAAKLHALTSYSFSRQTDLSVSGGWSHINTQVTTGGNGTAVGYGPSAFARTDFRHRDTRFRFFWNGGRTKAREFNALQDPRLDYDTYDVNLEQTIDLPFSNTLVAGAGYRKNVIDSALFAGTISQDLWALFLEDEWRFWERWALVASGRLDRHPFTGLVLSPRGSLIFNPAQRQTLRFSAGTSFRNPTLLENYLNLTQTLPNTGSAAPNPPFTSIQSSFLGNTALDPERMRMFELAYSGRFRRVRVTAAGFHYRLKDLIAATPTQISSTMPPTLGVTSSFTNRGGVQAWGGELGTEVQVFRPLTVFAHYAYQSLRDAEPAATSALGSPRHKVGAGVLASHGGWSGSFWGQWVDETFWNQNPPSIGTISYARVPDYLILNARAAYAFSGKWKGLELALSVFNLADREHLQILSAISPALPGQNGEIVRSRWMGTVTYRF